MDLRTGRTVWQLENDPPAALPQLDTDVRCEVAIVGAGITGVLVALELVKAGLDCVLIDKSESGAGSTTASTALLLYELDTPLCKLAKQKGEEDAVACYRGCLEGIGKIERVLLEEGVSCDFRWRESFLIAENERDVSLLEDEFAIRQRHGFKVELLRAAELKELFSFSRPAALRSYEAAEVDVLKMVKLLVSRARARGLRAFGRTALVELRREGDGFRLQTNAGCTVSARRVIFATGYESDKYLGRKVGRMKATYAIATTPLTHFPGWHERALLWTTDHPYLYLRTTAGGRAVIGGEDVDFEDEERRDALLPEKAEKLAAALRAFFPALEFEIECAWAGTFAETDDSLARIGQPSEHPGIYFALGYGGNGITYSMVAAEILREACLGRGHPLARLFAFDH